MYQTLASNVNTLKDRGLQNKDAEISIVVLDKKT